MSSASDGFTVHETHRILLQPGFEISVSSDKRGWSSLYASVQREVPYEGCFNAVDHQLIVLHLDGPATVHRRIPKGEDSRLIPAGGMTMMPGGTDFRVRLGEPPHTLHLYLRRALVEEVAGTILSGDPAHVEILPRLGASDPVIESLMLGVRDALHDENPSATPYVDYLARAIAAQLVQRHSSGSPARRSSDTSVSLTGGALSNAIDFMQANLERSIPNLRPHHVVQRVQVDVAQQRRDHRPLGCALFRHVFLVVFQNALAAKRLDRFQDAAIGRVAGHEGQQAIFRAILDTPIIHPGRFEFV